MYIESEERNLILKCLKYGTVITSRYSKPVISVPFSVKITSKNKIDVKTAGEGFRSPLWMSIVSVCVYGWYKKYWVGQNGLSNPGQTFWPTQ